MKSLDYTVIINNWPFLMLGLRETLRISSLAVTMGFCIGSTVALARLSRYHILKLISGAYIEFIRGTPLLVQLFILYYGLPQLGIDLDRRAAAAIGLSITAVPMWLKLCEPGYSPSTKDRWRRPVPWA